MIDTQINLTDSRRQMAVEVTGQQPQAAIKLQLDFLRQNGILVDLSITGSGMFQKTPNWVELGIADWAEDERVKQFTRGSKYLYPEQKIRDIKSIESRLRQNLDRHSREVTGFKPYRWIPYTAYQAWRDKHDAIVADGEALKADLIANRNQYVDEIAAIYAEVAESAWVAATSGEMDGRRVQIYQYVQVFDKRAHKQRALDHEEFLSFIVETTIAQIPTVEDIQEKLRWDYTTALVYGEQDAAADQARAEAIREQIDLARQLSQAEAEKAKLENQRLAEQVRAEAWAIQQRQQAIAAEREAKIAAMRQAEYEHNVQQLKETISPFAEIYRAAISQFVDHAREMLESVRKNNHVRGKVAERGRGLLDLYQLMVLPGLGSEKMEVYLRELREMLPKETEKRSPDEIAAKLEEIIALEAEIADDLNAGPSVFSFLEF